MRYLIIGNGAAGNAAAGAIRKRDPGGEVLIISEEAHQAYYRPLIPALIDDGTGKDSLFQEDPTGPEGVDVRLGVRVTAIDPGARSLTLANGETLSYDRLLMATGSSPIRPSIIGLDGPGVHVLRTIIDAEAIKTAAKEAGRAVIIGGGRVGMKAALALRQRGLEVTVVEILPRVVPLQFDEVASEIVGRAVASKGIRLILGQSVQRVERQDGRVKGVVLDDGSSLEADFIVVAVGVEANIGLARAAGIAVNRGVLANQYLQTSDPHIYAAGDVVETVDLITGETMVSGIWTNAVEMGRAAGENMAGEESAYPGAFGVLNALELADIPAVSVGLIEPPMDDGYQVHTTRRGETYRKLVLRDGILVGALLIGEIEGAGVYTGLIRRKADLGPLREALMARRPNYAPWLLWEASEFRA